MLITEQYHEPVPLSRSFRYFLKEPCIKLSFLIGSCFSVFFVCLFFPALLLFFDNWKMLAYPSKPTFHLWKKKIYRLSEKSTVPLLEGWWKWSTGVHSQLKQSLTQVLLEPWNDALQIHPSSEICVQVHKHLTSVIPHRIWSTGQGTQALLVLQMLFWPSPCSSFWRWFNLNQLIFLSKRLQD